MAIERWEVRDDARASGKRKGERAEGGGME